MVSIKNTSVKLAFIAVLAVSFIGIPIPHAAEESAKQIASVNDQILTRQDLDREIKLVSLKLARQGRPVDDAQLMRYAGSIRETLIKRTLLLQQAESMDVGVKDHLVAKALAEFKATFAGQKDYEKALKKMGVDETGLSDHIREGLVIKALLDTEVIEKTALPDKQVRAYYDDNPQLFQRPEQVKASHILIQVPASADKNDPNRIASLVAANSSVSEYANETTNILMVNPIPDNKAAP